MSLCGLRVSAGCAGESQRSRKAEIAIRHSGRVVERVEGSVSERGQHHVIAVAAVIVDRKRLTVGGELRALCQPGKLAVYRVAPEIVDYLEYSAPRRVK